MNQGLTLLLAWIEMAAVLGVLGYWILRKPDE